MSDRDPPLVRVGAGVVEHRARRRRPPTRALDGASIAISPGDHLALLGPNGSGKSTLLRVLMGLQPLTCGSIQRRPGLRLGVVFQSPALDPLLTVRENLRLQASLSGLRGADERIDRLSADLGVEDRLDSRVRTLSGGLARRVEFVRAILAEPDLLLLDEPTVGLDPPSRAALLGAIDALRARRPVLAVVMTTHLMTDAERFDRVLMMASGRVVHAGSPGELVAELGGLLLVVPQGAAPQHADLPWQHQADGSVFVQPRDEDQLAQWSAMLASAGVPFSVRRPTLADAYMRWARAPLGAAS